MLQGSPGHSRCPAGPLSHSSKPLLGWTVPQPRSTSRLHEDAYSGYGNTLPGWCLQPEAARRQGTSLATSAHSRGILSRQPASVFLLVKNGDPRTGNQQLTSRLGFPWMQVVLVLWMSWTGRSSQKGTLTPPPTCFALQRTPLNSDFRNGSNQRAVPISFTDEIYDFVGDLLDRVSIIPDVFSRLKKEASDTGVRDAHQSLLLKII